jgi:hypothetical protein
VATSLSWQAPANRTLHTTNDGTLFDLIIGDRSLF